MLSLSPHPSGFDKSFRLIDNETGASLFVALHYGLDDNVLDCL